MLGKRMFPRSSSLRISVALLIAICVGGVERLSAQSVGANIGGVVTDPSGARLPGVTVTVTNSANGATQTFVTGPEGNYRAVALLPGPYTIKAELQGFTPQSRSVTLTVGADTVMNLALSLATMQENVTVTGTASAISVTKAELASVVLPS